VVDAIGVRVELEVQGSREALCRDVGVVEEDVGKRRRAKEDERCDEEEECTEVEASSGFGSGVAERSEGNIADCD
jgi:hypothetical protein